MPIPCPYVLCHSVVSSSLIIVVHHHHHHLSLSLYCVSFAPHGSPISLPSAGSLIRHRSCGPVVLQRGQDTIPQALFLLLLLLSEILDPLSLHEISPDGPQVPRGLLDQLARFRALLQSLQQRRDLPIVVQVRARPAVPQVCDPAKTTVLDPRHFETTPTHGVLFTARRTLVRRWHTLTRANVKIRVSVEMRGLSKRYPDSFEGPRCTIEKSHTSVSASLGRRTRPTLDGTSGPTIGLVVDAQILIFTVRLFWSSVIGILRSRPSFVFVLVHNRLGLFTVSGSAVVDSLSNH